MPIKGIQAKPANSSLNHFGAIFVMVMASGVSVSVAGEYIPQTYQMHVDTSLQKISFKNNELQKQLSISGYAFKMSKASFPEALGRAAQGHQFTMVADRHDMPEVREAFFARETYDVLKKQGVKHIFLETPIEMQRVYDQYSAGKITRDRFIDVMSEKMSSGSVSPEERPKLFGLHADLLDAAKKDGIKVWCANERYKLVDDLSKDPAVMRDYRQNAPLDKFSGERIDFRDYLFEKKSEQMPDGTMVSPLMSDARVAKFMQEKAGKDKAAVFYGALHLTTTHGMDELIGKDKAATVIITNGRMDRVHRAFNDIAARVFGDFKPDSTPATLSYDLSSGEATFGALKAEEPIVDMSGLQGNKAGAPAGKLPKQKPQQLRAP